MCRMIRRCAGWTTVEIAVVAALGAILLATSIPAMNRNLEQFRLDTAAYAVCGDLQLAKIQALKKNTSVTVTMSYQNSTWGIAGGSARSLSRTITFSTTTPASVTFDSRGRSTSAGTLTITLNNSQGQSLTITILTTGKITVS